MGLLLNNEFEYIGSMAQQLFKFIQMSLMKIICKFMQHNFQMRYLRLDFFNFNFSRTEIASLALFSPKITETLIIGIL